MVSRILKMRVEEISRYGKVAAKIRFYKRRGI
jgi:hypothetical protein